MRCGGDLGHFLDKGHVLGMVADFKVADQGAVSGTAKGAKLGFIDLFEKG